MTPVSKRAKEHLTPEQGHTLLVFMAGLIWGALFVLVCWRLSEFFA